MLFASFWHACERSFSVLLLATRSSTHDPIEEFGGCRSSSFFSSRREGHPVAATKIAETGGSRGTESKKSVWRRRVRVRLCWSHNRKSALDVFRLSVADRQTDNGLPWPGLPTPHPRFDVRKPGKYVRFGVERQLMNVQEKMRAKRASGPPGLPRLGPAERPGCVARRRVPWPELRCTWSAYLASNTRVRLRSTEYSTQRYVRAVDNNRLMMGCVRGEGGGAFLA